MEQNPHQGAQLRQGTQENGSLVDLTELEGRFVDCAAKGEEFDCAPNGEVTGEEIHEIKDWDKRKIRAKVIVALCTGEESGWSVHPRRGLRLRGACVVGLGDLSRAQLSQCPLAFHTCRFEESVVLDRATTTDITFTSCTLPSLSGDELNSSGGLALRKTHLGWVSLREARFRSVDFIEAHLSSFDEVALDADGLNAANVFLRACLVRVRVKPFGVLWRTRRTCLRTLFGRNASKTEEAGAQKRLT